jgi:hypothetical protein
MVTETNNLIELIDKMIDKKPRLVVENTINNYGTYKVEIYLDSDPEDKVFISGNKRFIKDFFDKGYERAGIRTFAGCLNANSVKSNTSMLKVAIYFMTVGNSHTNSAMTSSHISFFKVTNRRR